MIPGNADGLGETRKKELVKSAMTLGLRQEDDVFVLDSPYGYFLPPTPFPVLPPSKAKKKKKRKR